jgi:murein L,D-transpeptidase YafK
LQNEDKKLYNEIKGLIKKFKFKEALEILWNQRKYHMD